MNLYCVLALACLAFLATGCGRGRPARAPATQLSRGSATRPGQAPATRAARAPATRMRDEVAGPVALRMDTGSGFFGGEEVSVAIIARSFDLDLNRFAVERVVATDPTGAQLPWSVERRADSKNGPLVCVIVEAKDAGSVIDLDVLVSYRDTPYRLRARFGPYADRGDGTGTEWHRTSVQVR